MAKKINVKLILELRSAGMGRNAIAASRHISKNSVGDCKCQALFYIVR